MATMRISDVSGELIDGGGACVRLTFTDRSRSPLQADLTDGEAAQLIALLKDMGADLAWLEGLGATQGDFAKRIAEVQHSSPKAWERWSQEDENVLLDMYRQGRSVDDIAERLGRRPNGIRSRLIKLGAVDGHVGDVRGGDV